MRNLVVSCLICVAVGSLGTPAAEAQAVTAAVGEEALDVSDWADGPAGCLLTKKERKDWSGLDSNAARRTFIDLFWARRNPDPSQSFNQFKAQFESRVRYADENFSYGDRRGALTDRGRVLILLGPPQHAEHRAATETVQSLGDVGTAPTSGATDEVRANAVMWAYDAARLPAGFKVRGSRLLFVFYEERAESDNFILDRSHPDATLGMRLLAQAPDVYVLHPELNEVPKPIAMPGGRPATPAHLAWLDGPAPPWADRAQALVEVGVADPAQRPVWLHLELPGDAPKLDLLAGRVKSPDGEVLSTFELAATPLARGSHAAYHLSFPLAEGSYGLEVVGAAAEQALVRFASEVTVPAAPAEGGWMSPIWVGVETDIEDKAVLGAAYCFGRLHLLPLLTGSQVTRGNELTFLGFVVRPALDDTGSPKLEAQIALTREGRRLGRPLGMSVEAVEVTSGLFVYMNAVSLSGLPELGTYGLVFTITDALSDLTAERELSIELTE